jgi:hypothetical protein
MQEQGAQGEGGQGSRGAEENPRVARGPKRAQKKGCPGGGTEPEGTQGDMLTKSGLGGATPGAP